MQSTKLSMQKGIKKQSDTSLFFGRWLKNPLQMGSIIPSSPRLGQLIAQHIDRHSKSRILELGAGTGAITRSLINSGVSASRITMLEIEPNMARHLSEKFCDATVICGDAFNLPIDKIKLGGNEVGAVICGIPLVLLGTEKQRQFIDQVQAVAPGKGFLLYTYCITSPLPYEALGLEARRLAWTPFNFPPASVWHYRPKS